MDYLVKYLILTFDDKTSVAIAERVMHQKVLHATIKFILKVRGVNVITST